MKLDIAYFTLSTTVTCCYYSSTRLFHRQVHNNMWKDGEKRGGERFSIRVLYLSLLGVKDSEPTFASLE